MKITNENGYLIIKGMEIDDGFELKMLKNNTPSGFLNLKVMCLDNVKQYEYQISSMIDFKSYMEKNSLKADDIESYVKCITECMNELSRYMIDSHRIVPMPETIFLKDGKFYFCVLPGYEDFDNDLRLTLEYMLEHIDYKDNKAVVLMYKLYHAITREDIKINEFIIAEDEEATKAIEEEKNEFVKKREIVIEKKFKPDTLTTGMIGLCIIFLIASLLTGILPIPVKIVIALTLVTGALAILLLKRDYTIYKSNNKVINPEEDINDGLTTLLTKLPPYLICGDEKETKIPIDTIPFILGSGRENVDYRLLRRSVSRLHARIFSEGERYFIEDLGSTNGTRVNKKKLAPHEIVEIRDRDIITISDVEMTYYNSSF